MELIPAAVDGNAPRRVVLDCDTANEIDDQFAIAHALGSPGLDVRGIVSVQNTLVDGSRSVERYQREARYLAELCDRPDVPCPQGASAPMEDAHSPVVSEGLELLIEEAREGPYTLLATGPATDAASLALSAPELVDQVQVVWAGAFPDARTWQRYKFGELNARADIQSWRALFAADWPLWVLPGWPGVEKVVVDYTETIARLREPTAPPVNAYLGELFDTYFEARDGQLDMDTRGRGADIKVLWDVVNVAALTVPEAVTWEQRPIPAVDPSGVPDWGHPGRLAPWGLDVDATMVLDDLWRALSHPVQSTERN